MFAPLISLPACLMGSTPASPYYLRHLRSCACGASGSNTSGSVCGALDLCFALPWISSPCILPFGWFSSPCPSYSWNTFNTSNLLQLPTSWPAVSQNISFPLQLRGPGPTFTQHASHSLQLIPAPLPHITQNSSFIIHLNASGSSSVSSKCVNENVDLNNASLPSIVTIPATTTLETLQPVSLIPVSLAAAAILLILAICCLFPFQ